MNQPHRYRFELEDRVTFQGDETRATFRVTSRGQNIDGSEMYQIDGTSLWYHVDNFDPAPVLRPRYSEDDVRAALSRLDGEYLANPDADVSVSVHADGRVVLSLRDADRDGPDEDFDITIKRSTQ